MMKDRLQSIAEELLILSGNPQTGDENVAQPNQADQRYSREALSTYARALYQDRRARALEIPHDLLGEPAWDLLLDLFVNKCQERRVSVKCAVMAAAVPAATAHRWIQLLVDQGLACRDNDPTDNRRKFISLSGRGEAAVIRILSQSLKRLRRAVAQQNLERSS